MIDRATVDKILDAADIVDVVSDFVTLKKRGQNYIGLCPFHNDNHPSFYVSPAKGICKCFACGKGGSAVNFIMEHEQLTYPEALRYLARKFNIEIHEKELTDEEREAQTERESMLLINEFAMQFFENQLHNTTDGQEIGMSYFRERAFSDESIREFHLGYSPEDRSALYKAATKAGYNKKLLFDTGLCIDDNRGGGYDRFRGRVMFPIFNIAGKVIGFGGRTLKNDPAKYVNSPESIIYNKRNELYGLFQAKRDINKQDKCFIVEGYADVIQMHQAGFKNVIASSGTALTEGHIHKIRRFTRNVTELFDGDAAGVHAALRGVDMLLHNGLNIKVLLLPEPEDPDSFARAHSHSEIERYIADNEIDFIRFKTRVLLKDSDNDPVKRAAAIGDIVKSIAVIPDEITRAVYAKECSTTLGIDEDVILSQIQKDIFGRRQEEWKQEQREKRKRGEQQPSPVQPSPGAGDASQKTDNTSAAYLRRYEFDVIRYVAKYGMCYLCETNYDDGTSRPTTVLEYINNELTVDNIKFSDPVFDKIFTSSLGNLEPFYSALQQFQADIEQERRRLVEEGVSHIRAEVDGTLESIEDQERQLEAKIEQQLQAQVVQFRKSYLEKRLCSDPDETVRAVSLDLVSEKHQLSKIHTQFAAITSEYDKLLTLIPEALYNWKNAIVSLEFTSIQEKLRMASPEEQLELLKRQQQLNVMRRELSKLTGERVVNPLV